MLRRFTGKRLRRAAIKTNNRKRKKIIYSQYLSIKKRLLRDSARGEYSITINIDLTSYYGSIAFCAVRYFRKRHKDFKVIIKPFKEHENWTFWDCEEIRVIISFK